MLSSNLIKTFHQICTPNPSKYPNPEEAKRLFSRNKLNFLVHLCIFLLPAIVSPFMNFPLLFSLIRIGSLFTLLLIFTLTCRSYLHIGHALNTIIANLATFFLICQPEGVYFQLSLANMIPIVLYLITQNPYAAGASAAFHGILLFAKFKHSLLEILLTTDPEYFVENFVKKIAFAFLTIQAIYLMVFLTLNKRTEELSKARKAAEDALDQQKTFVYSFSHEMRNPMNSLLGNLDLALMTNLSPDLRNMLNTAKTCGVLLLNHINTVLDAGKMGLAKLEVKPTSSRVHEVFQRIWMISQDLIAQKGLKNHIKIEKRVPPLLLLDSHRLGQVLLNLLGNAIKFTQAGSISVTVQWLENSTLNDECFEPKPYDDEDEGIFEKEEIVNFYRLSNFNKEYLILNHKEKEFNLNGITPNDEHETHGVLKIIVSDTGCGISSQEIPKLFGKFSQVGNDAYQKSMGTGLGLYISQEICKNMNGDIRVYSKPKHGTTFIVCIPTTTLPIQKQQQQQYFANDLNRIIEGLQSKKLKIIIADDSPFNVNLVTNFCYKFGAQIIAATGDGLNAYKKYIQSIKSGIHVDVVTLDIDMPLMDGKEACEKIRQYERENNLKPAIIVLISGNYEVQQVGNMIGGKVERKADCFIRKPLVFSEFCWVLYKYSYNVEI